MDDSISLFSTTPLTQITISSSFKYLLQRIDSLEKRLDCLYKLVPLQSDIKPRSEQNKDEIEKVVKAEDSVKLEIDNEVPYFWTDANCNSAGDNLSTNGEIDIKRWNEPDTFEQLLNKLDTKPYQLNLENDTTELSVPNIEIPSCSLSLTDSQAKEISKANNSTKSNDSEEFIRDKHKNT